MPLPIALVNLLGRKGLEGRWDAEQGEINEAILKATGLDHEKTRILMRMPEVRTHVANERKNHPLAMRAINSEYGGRFKKLGAELEALQNAGPEAEEAIEEKQREIDACKTAQKEELDACKSNFFKKLGRYLTQTLENKRVYETRGWSDEIPPELAMYRAGEDVELEGRGAGVIRGTTVRGPYTSAALEPKSNTHGASRSS